MWKIFAVLYSLAFAFGLVFIGYLAAIGALLGLSSIGWIMIYTSMFMALGTTIGLVAYAFNLNVPPLALWRPFSWLAGVWAFFASYTSFTKFLSVAAGSSGNDLITNVLWLSLALAIHGFSWLGVWRYGRRVSAAA
jgi:hypothetical protein